MSNTKAQLSTRPKGGIMSTHTLTPEEVQILKEAHKQEEMEELLADLIKNVEFRKDGTIIEYDENHEIIAIWF